MTRLLIVASLLMLAGCGPSVPPNLQMSVMRDHPDVSITQIATFADPIAYGGVRGVYMITDKKTGDKFIGISGVGISQLGQHPTGKTQTRDER